MSSEVAPITGLPYQRCPGCGELSEVSGIDGGPCCRCLGNKIGYGVSPDFESYREYVVQRMNAAKLSLAPEVWDGGRTPWIRLRMRLSIQAKRAGERLSWWLWP